MADNDILRAIQIIDAKIASLQEARNRLANAFGIGQEAPQVTYVGPPLPAADAALSSPQPPNVQDGPTRPSGRKVELAQFLLANGPMSRVAIVERSGLPEGTVSYCLADKRFFEQAADGSWHITEYSRRGLERQARTGSFQMEH